MRFLLAACEGGGVVPPEMGVVRAEIEAIHSSASATVTA